MSIQPNTGATAAEHANAEAERKEHRYLSAGEAERDVLRESPGFYKRAWRKLKKDKVAITALVFTAIILIFAFGAPVVSMLTGHDYATGNLRARLLPPLSDSHILGTDNNGRDLLTRLAYGGRISMMVAVIALLFSLSIGLTVGAVAGYFGGLIDSILMRFVDIIISIPSITLLLLVSTWIRPGPVGLALVIGALGWTGTSRLIRGEVMALKNRDYVDAARVLGASNSQIIVKHIMPNVVSLVIVAVSLSLPGLILTEASLSYLGFGVKMPIPSWGNMLNDSRGSIAQSWWFTFFPGFMITFTALCINLLGIGLRDALDPRLNEA